MVHGIRHQQAWDLISKLFLLAINYLGRNQGRCFPFAVIPLAEESMENLARDKSVGFIALVILFCQETVLLFDSR